MQSRFLQTRWGAGFFNNVLKKEIRVTYLQLWDVVPDSLVMHTVRSSTESASVIADKLKGLALQHRSMDNIAVVVVKIKNKSTA